MYRSLGRRKSKLSAPALIGIGNVDDDDDSDGIRADRRETEMRMD